MMSNIPEIILFVILGTGVIYCIGRLLAKGFFDEIENKLSDKFKEHKSKNNERKEE